MARLLGAHRRNIALTQNSTTAFAQALDVFDFASGDVILTSRADYASNQIMYLSLARRLGVEIVRAPDLPEGGVDPDAVRDLVRRHRPTLVALTWVPTNSGLVQAVRRHRRDLPRRGGPLPGRRLPGGGAAADRRARPSAATTWPARRASFSGAPAASAFSTCPTRPSRPGRIRCWSTCTAPPGPTPTASS